MSHIPVLAESVPNERDSGNGWPQLAYDRRDVTKTQEESGVKQTQQP